MKRLFYGENEVELRESDTVLEALLRDGIDVPYSCASGVCQSCIVRCEGPAPVKAQAGLKETLAAQGYFLACQCRSSDIGEASIRIYPSDQESLFQSATLKSREFVAANVAKLVFELGEPMAYEPGQFIHLRRSDGLVRSYSIASDPGSQSTVELHIGRVSGGEMSTYLLDDLECGQTMSLRGPSGDCFYVPGRADQPVLLVGTGTGLAPLLGVIRTALASGHSGPLHLFHGSTSPEGVYLRDELRAMAQAHAQLTYTATVDDAPDADLARLGLVKGRSSELALKEHPSLKGWRVFLCGHPAMVKTARKLCYLSGAAISDIFADPFEVLSAPKST